MLEKTQRDRPVPGWSDASLFPVQFDPEHGEICMMRLPMDVVSRTVFLDHRMDVDWESTVRVPWQELHVANPVAPPALLFHTAFCGSTLLSRALQTPPDVVALREPKALQSLASLALHVGPLQIAPQLETVLRLLSRPWTEGGRCLIKPNNLSNNLLPQVLQMTDGKAILLYSSLPEFVVSCFKKLPGLEEFMPAAARHLCHGTELLRRLSAPTNHVFHFVEACVLVWYAQMEIYANVLSADSRHQLRSVDLATLLDRPLETVLASAQWLELGEHGARWEQNTSTEFRRNAKQTTNAFDASDRQREHAAVSERYAEPIRAALRWADKFVAPIAKTPVRWKPLIASAQDPRR